MTDSGDLEFAVHQEREEARVASVTYQLGAKLSEASQRLRQPQDTGGMVLTNDWLCELVPIENATMADRTVIEWDKHDLDALGILKVDVLALGMLSAIRKCFDLVR